MSHDSLSTPRRRTRPRLIAGSISPHARAVLQALFVTFLWSTSWVLIKIGLAGIPALTFAGLRYGLAVLCLLPFVAAAPARRTTLGHISRRSWGHLALLGLVYIGVTQGAQFLALVTLPAVTVSLLLNCTPLVVALLGWGLLAERPGALQWAGLSLFLVGAGIYFDPITLPAGQAAGFLIALVGVLANAGSSVLGRTINRAGDSAPLLVTIVSMSIGAVALLIAGLLIQGLPALTPLHWAIIAWLAVVNTAGAFTLWNHTLRTLSAFESSLINSTMLVQIAVLAWLFLGEALSGPQILGLILAGSGALLVQWRRAVPPRQEQT